MSSVFMFTFPHYFCISLPLSTTTILFPCPPALVFNCVLLPPAPVINYVLLPPCPPKGGVRNT